MIADTIINDPDVYEAATKDDEVKQADDASADPSAFNDLTVTSESPAKRPRIGDDDVVTPTETAHVTQVSPATASSTRPSSAPIGGEYAALIQALQSNNCTLTLELDMQLDRFLTKAIKLKQNQTSNSIVFSYKITETAKSKLMRNLRRTALIKLSQGIANGLSTFSKSTAMATK